VIDRRLDFYIQELYELVKILSLDQFVELHNRTFHEEQPLTIKDFSLNLKEQEEKLEFISQISSFEREELKRIYNLANQILTRRT
jgi:hypothetical protein